MQLLQGVRSNWTGRDNSTPQRIQDQFWRIHGRVVADAWWNVKREIHPKQESLAYVSQELLNESKGDVDRLSIDQEWQKDKDRVVKYCIKDSLLALKILDLVSVLVREIVHGHCNVLPVCLPYYKGVYEGGVARVPDVVERLILLTG